MLSATVPDARTTLLILPVVALRGDMLRRCQEVGIRPLVWRVGSRETAPLVLVAVESACTEQFLDYAKGLALRQQLDRIIIDECHLTITASSYRPSMALLGWHLRQVPTQTIWLTATLAPALEEAFIQQNRLVQPRVVRESTNRPNIQYLVSREAGPGRLVDRAAALVQAYQGHAQVSRESRDKVILYCRTRGVAEELGQLLSCPVYTSRAGTEQEKAALLAGWLANTSLPALVATSALGVGFDYPWVRWVVHVDAPTELTAFAQESGRAGRGGGRAASIILLSAAWAPDLSPGRALGPDQQAMQLYLAQQHCARGVLSQFLDAEQDWRWCMAGEEPCGVCQQQQPHATPRPQGLIFSQAPPPSPLATAPSPAAPASISTTTPTVPPPAAVAAGQFTGPAEVLRQDYLQSQALGQYEQDLETLALLGSCSYCRVLGRDNSHLPQACPRRFEWIRAKRQTLRACKQSHKAWIQPYIVC